MKEALGKFDKYKIDLKGMQADSCKYEFVLDNLFFANIDGPEVQKGKVNVVLVVKKTSRAFELSSKRMVWYGYRATVVWMTWSNRLVLLISCW